MDYIDDEMHASEELSAANQLDVDFHTSISSVVPVIPDNHDQYQELPSFSVRQIYRNLLVLSVAFVLMFTAYNGIAALQSSLNTKGNVGVNSLIITNAFVLVSSLFLTGIVMDIFGLKWTMILAGFGFLSYMAANILPLPSLMYISASLMGLGAAPMWTSQATYINRLAHYYAHHKNKNPDVIVSLFFGIFFAVFATSIIWGNLVSYFVLDQSSDPQRFNCGIHFDPQASVGINESEGLQAKTRYILCGTYVGMGLISMCLLCFLLDQIRLSHSQTRSQSIRKSFDVLRSLVQWKHADQWLLVPISIWTMMETAFLTAQFTRAFITCLVGIRFIGLVLMVNGVCHAISSYLFGALVKYIGRFGCFVIAAVLNYTMILVMFFWEPDEKEIFVLFIIAGAWGMSAAIWQSQVVATYTVFHASKDPTAIAKYRLWKAIGSLLNYSYASYINIHVTMIILLCFLTISMFFYILAETNARRKSNDESLKKVLN